LHKDYIEAVAAIGGISIILPALVPHKMIRETLDICDGLVLSDRLDIDPLIFGEEPKTVNGGIYPECDCFEIEITRYALQKNAAADYMPRSAVIKRGNR